MNVKTWGDPVLVATLPASLANVASGLNSLRTTPGVIAELIHDSKSEVLISTPFLSAGDRHIGGESLFEALSAASRRGVLLRFLLSEDGASLYRQQALSTQFPKAEVYSPVDPQRDGGQLGSHAKVVIADRLRAYIGSANLTTRGMHGNLELGTLVEGIVAEDCWKLLHEAVTTGYFKRCV